MFLYCNYEVSSRAGLYFASCIVLVSCSCVAAVLVIHVHKLGTSAPLPPLTSAVPPRTQAAAASPHTETSNAIGNSRPSLGASTLPPPLSCPQPQVPRWIRLLIRALASWVPFLWSDANLFDFQLQNQQVRMEQSSLT